MVQLFLTPEVLTVPKYIGGSGPKMPKPRAVVPDDANSWVISEEFEGRGLKGGAPMNLYIIHPKGQPVNTRVVPVGDPDVYKYCSQKVIEDWVNEEETRQQALDDEKEERKFNKKGKRIGRPPKKSQKAKAGEPSLSKPSVDIVAPTEDEDTNVKSPVRNRDGPSLNYSPAQLKRKLEIVEESTEEEEASPVPSRKKTKEQKIQDSDTDIRKAIPDKHKSSRFSTQQQTPIPSTLSTLPFSTSRRRSSRLSAEEHPVTSSSPSQKLTRQPAVDTSDSAVVIRCKRVTFPPTQDPEDSYTNPIPPKKSKSTNNESPAKSKKENGSAAKNKIIDTSTQVSDNEWPVDCLLDDKLRKLGKSNRKVHMYLVRWEGDWDPTWEKAVNISTELKAEYHKALKEGTLTKSDTPKSGKTKGKGRHAKEGVPGLLTASEDISGVDGTDEAGPGKGARRGLAPQVDLTTSKDDPIIISDVASSNTSSEGDSAVSSGLFVPQDQNEILPPFRNLPKTPTLEIDANMDDPDDASVYESADNDDHGQKKIGGRSTEREIPETQMVKTGPFQMEVDNDEDNDAVVTPMVNQTQVTISVDQTKIDRVATWIGETQVHAQIDAQLGATDTIDKSDSDEEI
jgi:hypothetical protein